MAILMEVDNLPVWNVLLIKSVRQFNAQFDRFANISLDKLTR